jgi:anti-anti-sigma regulatory factor
MSSEDYLLPAGYMWSLPKQSFNKKGVPRRRQNLLKMTVKIDTKEKFHVISIQEPVLTANMTGELADLIKTCREGTVKNIIINLKGTGSVEPEAALFLLQAQQESYDQHQSFVVCEVPPATEDWLEQHEYLELMNITPTESEAWDIVQMEEIERELF